MKTTLLTVLALSAALFSPLASAQAPGHGRGHYEERAVQQWVPGAYVQVQLPGKCRQLHHWQKCRPGAVVTRWIPGHYDTVMQKVWVRDFHRDDDRRGPRGYGYVPAPPQGTSAQVQITPRGVGFQVAGRL